VRLLASKASAVLMVVLSGAGLRGPGVQAGEFALLVTGEVKSELKLTLAEVEGMTNSTVTVTEREGGNSKYEGVLFHEILRRAGVPLGEGLRGDALRLCVLVKATDGYKAVFSLAELDAGQSEKKVLLAFRHDGKELDAEAGPLRLVIPDEKRHSRWVRRVIEVEVIRVGGPAKK
jgi:DMSO/TMAO reductase YedYZ molybdopterin-dependent catalytic subunit